MEGPGKLDWESEETLLYVLVVQMEIVVQLANKILIKGECPRHLEQLLWGVWRLREKSTYPTSGKAEVGSASKERRSWPLSKGLQSRRNKKSSRARYTKNSTK
jgi:hypothetical protein